MPHGLGPVVRSCVLLLALALGGCARGPSFAEVAGTLPSSPAGTARVYVYRYLQPYDSMAWTPVYFNDRYAGASAPGSVFFRDVPPGRYTFSVLSVGLYPDQFKTVTLAAGQSLYLRVEELDTWAAGKTGYADTFVVAVMDPAFAQAEIQGLTYMRGHPPG